MKVRNIYLAMMLLLSGACTNTQYTTTQAINKACAFELQAALTAVKLRDKNKSKSSLSEKLAPLQKDSSRLLVNMHQIVNEVYDHDWINEVTYSSYRFELCQRQLQHKQYPLTIKPILQSLRLCQEKYQLDHSKKSEKCITNSFDQYAQSLNPG